MPRRLLESRTQAAATTSIDVARLAQVSQATVSFVLNGLRTGGARVSDATRTRVLAAAAELEYVPNHAARSLRRRRTNVLTFVLPALDNPYFAEVVAAVQVAATQRGYIVSVLPVRDEEAELQALQALGGGSSDGVVVAARTDRIRDGVRRLFARGVKIVVFQDRSPEPLIPAVRVDLEGGGYAATRHLLALGHRHIAHIADRQSYSHRAGEDRFDGYERALSAAGLRMAPALVCDGENSMAGGEQAMCLLLERPGPRATAVFAYNDQMAMGALHALHARGLRVPEDMALVGFDGVALGAFTWPGLTTVEHPRNEIGTRAANLLIGCIEGGPPALEDVVLPARLVIRGSCGMALREQ